MERIEKSKWKNKPILEIGSGASGISDYYQGEVIGVDSDFAKTGTKKNTNIKYVEGLSDNLPFNNETFYLVVCLDTLEHLEKKLRIKTIRELIRVTKKGGIIYLGFPTGNLSEKYEIKLNNAFKRINHKNHLWLIEHRKYGLPNYRRILSAIKNLGIPKEKIEILENVNIFIWFIMHMLFTVYPESFFSRILKYAYLPIFFIAKIHLPPFYRIIFVINK
ncbi:MAG: class I SAM-dependent methyltransferase [Candidatus Daviesbacteria bacterium]|nr:class I SAM-dependent methyltransferase [Candidatus Daviesbacteria bacterium]